MLSSLYPLLGDFDNDKEDIQLCAEDQEYHECQVRSGHGRQEQVRSAQTRQRRREDTKSRG